MAGIKEMNSLIYIMIHDSISTLQMFTGIYRVPIGCFCRISMEKGCKNHRETLYSSKGKIVSVVGKPCNIYRFRGNPIVIIGFSPQPVRKIKIIIKIVLWEVSP